MGLDKRKRILTVDDFNCNPIDSENRMLSTFNKTSLPFLQNDVMLDRHEGVHYSVQYVLDRLLDNDKFIQQYLTKMRNYVNEDIVSRLLSSINSNVTIDDINQGRDIYLSMILNHWNEYHAFDTGSSLSSFCNLSTVSTEYLKTDMSNFDPKSAAINFQKTTGGDNLSSGTENFSISNDIVVDIEFDDSETVRSSKNYVAAYVSNDKTNNQFQTNMSQQIVTMNVVPDMTDCKYIYKKWLSGFKELYIYLPTTFTFYKGLDLEYGEEHPDENATFIKIGINYRHFNFNHIYQAHICGQSLPMHIETTKEKPYFNDIILPSMLRSMCVSNEPKNNTDMIKDNRTSMYYLYFTCYGTDAQAIRIFGD